MTSKNGDRFQRIDGILVGDLAQTISTQRLDDLDLAHVVVAAKSDMPLSVTLIRKLGQWAANELLRRQEDAA